LGGRSQAVVGGEVRRRAQRPSRGPEASAGPAGSDPRADHGRPDGRAFSRPDFRNRRAQPRRRDRQNKSPTHQTADVTAAPGDQQNRHDVLTCVTMKRRPLQGIPNQKRNRSPPAFATPNDGRHATRDTRSHQEEAPNQTRRSAHDPPRARGVRRLEPSASLQSDRPGAAASAFGHGSTATSSPPGKALVVGLYRARNQNLIEPCASPYFTFSSSYSCFSPPPYMAGWQRRTSAGRRSGSGSEGRGSTGSSSTAPPRSSTAANSDGTSTYEALRSRGIAVLLDNGRPPDGSLKEKPRPPRKSCCSSALGCGGSIRAPGGRGQGGRISDIIIGRPPDTTANSIGTREPGQRQGRGKLS